MCKQHSLFPYYSSEILRYAVEITVSKAGVVEFFFFKKDIDGFAIWCNDPTFCWFSAGRSRRRSSCSPVSAEAGRGQRSAADLTPGHLAVDRHRRWHEIEAEWAQSERQGAPRRPAASVTRLEVRPSSPPPPPPPPREAGTPEDAVAELVDVLRGQGDGSSEDTEDAAGRPEPDSSRTPTPQVRAWTPFLRLESGHQSIVQDRERQSSWWGPGNPRMVSWCLDRLHGIG